MTEALFSVPYTGSKSPSLRRFSMYKKTEGVAGPVPQGLLALESRAKSALLPEAEVVHNKAVRNPRLKSSLL